MISSNKNFNFSIKKQLKRTNSKFGEVPDWDFLDYMRIVQELEKRLKVEFDIDEIIDVDTVKKVIQLAKSKVK